MEVQDLFKKVHILTSKYPNLSVSEIHELQHLSQRLSKICSNAVFDMNYEAATENSVQ